MDLSIKKLKVLVAVAESGSFTEAAKLFSLTSAGLSLTVKSLEDDVGYKLFDRSTRSVKLTPAGQALLPYAEQLLADHKNLVQAVRAIGQKGEGAIRVTSTQAIGSTILPPALTSFGLAFPQIRVTLVDALFHRFQEILLRGEADIGIGPEVPCDDGIVAEELFTSRLHVACSLRHPLASRSEVQWSDLRDEKVIAIDAASRRIWSRDSNFQVLFDNAHSVGHVTTALALANQNAGITVLNGYVRQLTKCYDLALIELVDPVVFRRVMVYRNRRFALSPPTQRMIEFLKKSFSELG